MHKKIMYLFVGMTLSLPAVSYASTAYQTVVNGVTYTSSAQIQATINSLLAQVNVLKQQLVAMQQQEAAAQATQLAAQQTASNLYVPWTQAKAQADAWRASRPADASTLDILANTAQAGWFGNWNSNIYGDVQKFVNDAASKNQLPTLVFYNIPKRDCGSYSAGGSSDANAYWAWVGAAAAGIGDKPALVILEPDALANITCLSQADQANRLSMLSGAVSALKSHANVKVYIDAGNSHWVDATTMAARLKSAGVAQADGFSLNVSNYFTTADNVTYGTTLSSLLGGKHFVVDTSRNGQGPTTDSQWCNPSGRAVGKIPTTNTGNSLVDAFLWIKNPGESDGTCNGGPSAGTFWPDMALALVRNR